MKDHIAPFSGGEQVGPGGDVSDNGVTVRAYQRLCCRGLSHHHKDLRLSIEGKSLCEPATDEPTSRDEYAAPAKSFHCCVDSHGARPGILNRQPQLGG